MDFGKSISEASKKYSFHLNQIFEELQKELDSLENRREKLDAVISGLEEHSQKVQQSECLSEEDKTFKTKKKMPHIVQFNVGGKKIDIRRDTIHSQCAGWNLFSSIFSSRYEHYLLKDSSGRIFLDFDPSWIEPIFNCFRESALTDLSLEKPQPVVRRDQLLGYNAVSSYFGLDCWLKQPFICSDSTISCMNDDRCTENLHRHILETLHPGVSGYRVCLKRLFRGSEDGYSAATFHSQCDGRPNTLCVIKDDLNNVFGGFCDIPWSQSGQYVSSSTSFLFSVGPPPDFAVTKFSLLSGEADCAVFHDITYLCTFGEGYDLCITDNCHLNANSSSVLGYTYSREGGDANRLSNGREKFTVKEIEVYTISNIEEAKIPLQAINEFESLHNMHTAESDETNSLNNVSNEISSSNHKQNLPFVNRVLEHTETMSDLKSTSIEFVKKMTEQRQENDAVEIRLLKELLFVEHVSELCFLAAAETPSSFEKGVLRKWCRSSDEILSNNGSETLVKIEEVINRLYALEEAILKHKKTVLCGEQTENMPEIDDVVTFNAGGTIVCVRRSTILNGAPGSYLATRVSRRWDEHDNEIDEDGNFFEDVNPCYFLAIISYLRLKVLLGEDERNKVFVSKEDIPSLQKLLSFYGMNHAPFEAK